MLQSNVEWKRENAYKSEISWLYKMFFFQNQEFNEDTISSVYNILLRDLETIHKIKDEKELILDIWCHFGKVFVHNVDEGNIWTQGKFQSNDMLFWDLAAIYIVTFLVTFCRVNQGFRDYIPCT